MVYKTNEEERAYYAANANKISKQRRARYAANPEKYRKASRLSEKKYRAAHKKKIAARNKANRQQAWAKNYAKHAKDKFLDMYGRACECCGEDTFEFLTVEHRKGVKRTCFKRGAAAYAQAARKYDPEEYAVLCYNCNMSTKFGQICPHKLKHL